MSLGDDPFRKRDAGTSQSGGQDAAPPPYAGGPQPGSHGQPHYGPQQYGQQQYGAPYGQQPPYGGYQQQPPYGYPPPGYSQYGPAGSPPPGHLGWAITAVIFFWPLAIAAFINYARVEGRWYRGDAVGAQQASDSVKRYGIIALCIGLALIVLYFALFAVVFGTAVSGGHVSHSACISTNGGPC